MKRTRKRRDVTCDTVSSWADLDLLRARVGIVGRFGGVLRASWAISRLYWALLGAFCRCLGDMSGPSWPHWGVGHIGHIGSLLGSLMAFLRPFWGTFGPSWGNIGGRVRVRRARVMASCAVLGRRKAEEGQISQSCKSQRKINECGVLGGLLG